MRNIRNAPGALDARTAAAIGTDGRQAAPWLLQGVRQVTSLVSEQVWQGTAAFPTLPAVGGALEVVSNVGTDTGGGVGARTVEVLYLNARFHLRLARGTLAGLVPATCNLVDIQTGAVGAPVTDAFRVLAVDISTTGASDINDGEVDVTIATVQQARIPRQTTAITTMMRCRARPGGFTVPVGFCALLDTVDLGAGPVTSLQARPPRFPWMGVVGQGQKGLGIRPPGSPIPDPVVFSAGTDLRLVYEELLGGVPATTYTAPRVALYLHPSDETTDPNPDQIPSLGRCGFGVD